VVIDVVIDFGDHPGVEAPNGAREKSTRATIEDVENRLTISRLDFAVNPLDESEPPTC
jgi:hypothetical protein